MKIKLTELDRKILYVLDSDSRTQLTEIAKKFKSSPQVVKYRIERLIENGVIKRFITVVEYRRLGYINHIVYLRLRAIPKAKEDRMVKFLRSRADVNIVMKCDGNWDLAVGILSKDPFDLNESLERIHKEYGKYIDRESIATHIGAEHYPREYLLDERRIRHVIPTTGKRSPFRELSKNEEKVLSAVKEDARLSLVEIAGKAGLTPDIVKSAITRLIRDKVIVSFTFIPEYGNYGYSFYRILLNLKYVSPKRWNSFLVFARKNPNIFHIIRAFGGYSAVFDVEVKDQAEFRSFMRNVKEEFGDVILNYDALQISEVEKFTYFRPEQNI